MLSYKDKTFCQHSFICGNDKCPDKLDMWEHEEDSKQAGFDIPVSYTNMMAPNCGYFQRGFISWAHNEFNDNCLCNECRISQYP